MSDAGGDTPGVQAEPAEHLPGVPDAFGRLWTPHRMAYILGEKRPTDAGEDECPFCRARDVDDATGLVVHRGRTAFVVMNLFPYSPGHMLVCPYRHVALFTDATTEEAVEITELSRTAMRVLTTVSSPAGFNLGINQGAVGGAGVAAHLHQHVVPRWQGDTNFLPIIAQTRALPQLLEDARAALVAAWPTD